MLSARERTLFLLVVHVALLGWAIWANSVTFDESGNLAAGVAYWREGAFGIGNLSPPLLRLWAALPAVLWGAVAPPVELILELPSLARHWTYNELFLRENIGAYHAYFVLGRLSLLPLSCAGLLLTQRWAHELYGSRAGFAAGALYAISPNILAHGALITTDVGAMVAITASLWLWWRFCLEPKPYRWLLASVAIAVAHLCKPSAWFLWPALMAVSVWMAVHGQRRALWAGVIGMLGAFLMSVAAINVLYGFQGSGEPLGSYTLYSKLSGLAALLPDSLAVPFPREFLAGLDAQVYEADGRIHEYLFGEIYRGSKWYYYPIVLAVKLPVGTLILLLMGLAVAGRTVQMKRSQQLGEAPIILLILLGFIGALSLSLNAGLRYLLPLFPLTFIWLSRLWASAASGTRRRVWIRQVATLLLCAAVLESVASAPRFLSFVNVAAKSREEGYLLVNSGNFDLGQGLLDLKHWMDEQGVERICLAYQAPVDPAAYGIAYTSLAETWNPQGLPEITEAFVGISSYYLAGLSHRMRTPLGPTEFVDLPFHRQLQRQAPVAVAGSTIFIYSREVFMEAVERHAKKQTVRGYKEKS